MTELNDGSKKFFTRLGTHNGQFHCDEAVACFLLKQLQRKFSLKN